jgi:sulfate/thiosulfate-binding protein
MLLVVPAQLTARTWFTSTLLLALTACSPGASDSLGPTSTTAASHATGAGGSQVALVAFSTPQVVFDELIPSYSGTPAGKGIRFTTSYGASGDQSRAVAGGQKADVVMFSIEPDVTRLVKAGLVAADWNTGPSKGVLAQSQVGFIVRKGNPRHIATWDDLLKPGIKVLTPNPFSSGAAKWNLLAAYAHWSDGGKDRKAGLAKLTTLLTRHVPVQDKSGREALNSFTSGTGDVLLSYDYEVTTANRKGQDLQLVRPPDTLRIDLNYAVTVHAPALARSFADYALSAPGQEVFASWGYRPVDPAVLAEHRADFPDAAKLYGIEDLGGWSTVNSELFDPENGPIAKIQGVSTG